MRIDIFNANLKKRENMLALGPESSGNFSVCHQGKIYFCQSGTDLFDEKNFENFRKSVSIFLRKRKIKPSIILTDLHPRYRVTAWGEDLARKFGAENIKVQHHLAHIFSSFADKRTKKDPGREFTLNLEGDDEPLAGIVCDGTGFGLDGKIWGGEVFQVENINSKAKTLRRVGHLENQILIGGDLAVREPARMLISILSKFLDRKAVSNIVKKHYSRNELEVLHNQLQSGFNCQESSGTARILDAVSVLLGFSENYRGVKHGPAAMLEKFSACPYYLRPKIIYDVEEKKYILLTTPLFEYLLKNMNKDRRRLAATVQHYLAEGLHEILERWQSLSAGYKMQDKYFSGGISNNKIMSDYLSLQGFHLSKIIPRGDEGISLGQLIFYLTGISKS